MKEKRIAESHFPYRRALSLDRARCRSYSSPHGPQGLSQLPPKRIENEDLLEHNQIPSPSATFSLGHLPPEFCHQPQFPNRHARFEISPEVQALTTKEAL